MGLPVEVNNLMMGSLGGYNINRSLRFRSSASAYLNRTPANNGSSTTWTWSSWIKRGALGSSQVIFGSGNGSTTGTYIQFTTSNELEIYYYSSAYIWRFITTAVYRDPSSWYHIVVDYDSSNATASDRMRLYVNGVRVTAFGTSSTISLNQNTSINNNSYAHNISASGAYIDGYLAEVNFIDGQALTPSSFGAYDTNGVWQPKKYSGTYGTNGFYLPFSNTSSTTTLVADASGNGNNWTPNNISLTAGTTYDSMIDSPTVSASASNYCVLNSLCGGGTLSNGNLQMTTTAAVNRFGTIGVSSGKWYWECLMVAVGNTTIIGIGSNVNDTGDGSSYGYRAVDGNKYQNATGSAYGATYTTNDIIGMALDMDAGTITFYKNGVSQGVAFSGITGTWFPRVRAAGSGVTFTYDFNFGQRPFSYTPPTGFNALNTYNLPAPSIAAGNKHFDVSLWTGTGVAQAITNSGSFQPDLVWNKSRNNAGLTHIWTDSVRGVNSQLFSPLTNAQETRTDRLQSFNSNGFTVGTYTDVNQSAQTFVGWQWKGGGTGVTNNSGTITSTVSANPTAGFSIVTFTGTGANATVGHGLGVAPSMIIVKVRNGTGGWPIYHSGLTSAAYILELNTTGAQSSVPTAWNSTSPTSSVFSIGTAFGNGSTYVAYCFAAVSGYSAFGKYTGNGSADGPFIYTGFRPRFILVKDSSAIQNWRLFDSSRSTYNAVLEGLFPNLSNAESSAETGPDFLSNGFKIRTSSNTHNASGNTIIYAAFAEVPYNFARAR